MSTLSSEETHSAPLKSFLEAKQYNLTSLSKYEIAFGEGYVSLGGAHQTEWLCDTVLDRYFEGKTVTPRFLDVGCGFGAMPVTLTGRYGGTAVGVDLTASIIESAKERYGAHKQVQFLCGDVLDMNFAPESFDVIYSRDSILHIENKHKLFQAFFKWMTPGGLLLITDYACGPRDLWDEDFTGYVKDRGYFLCELLEYKKIVERAGFEKVEVTDVSQMMLGILEKENAELMSAGSKKRSTFLNSHTLAELQDYINSNTLKMKRITKGLRVHCIITALKPLDAENKTG